MDSVFTCDLCGQDGLDEEEMKTHRLVAHIEQDVSCMFCDLRGVTPEEMTYHINSVHSEEHNDNSSSMFSSSYERSVQQKHSHDGVDIYPGSIKSNSRTLLYDRSETSDGEGSASKRARCSETETDRPDADCLLCPLCRFVAETDAVLEVHIATDHSDDTDALGDSHADVEEISNSLFSCPVCLLGFTEEILLQLHIEDHFKQKPSSTSSARNGVLDSHSAQLKERQARENLKLQETRQLEAARASTQDTTSRPQNGQSSSSINTEDRDSLQGCTKGVLERLRVLTVGRGNSKITARYFCAATDHFQSYGWDCGYRNLQMLLSCLARNPVYLRALFNGVAVMPSVAKLQKLIEAAWSKGFDRAGCAQLQGRVVGTHKWIGATEIVAVLSSLRVKCQLYDFHQSTGPNSTHPALLTFVKNYFKNAQDAFIAPLYFQHQGHSRTIVGVEESTGSGSPTLLVFDPGCHKMSEQFLSAKSTELNGKIATLRRNSASITAKQYQIVSVIGVLTDDEYEKSKVIQSIRIP